jgi:hypothetical protein
MFESDKVASVAKQRKTFLTNRTNKIMESAKETGEFQH